MMMLVVSTVPFRAGFVEQIPNPPPPFPTSLPSMLEHISKPVATLFWSILGFLAGYSGVAMFDDFDSQFSGLLIIISAFLPSMLLLLA